MARINGMTRGEISERTNQVDTPLPEIVNREVCLFDHASRAKEAQKLLRELRQVAERLIDHADDYECDTSTNAWSSEGFTLDLYFVNPPLPGVMELYKHFDEFNLYNGGGHAASSSEYEWHLRASVKVNY